MKYRLFGYILWLLCGIKNSYNLSDLVHSASACLYVVTEFAFVWLIYFSVLGQIYRLQNPSARFLASLSAYDSSNPTKDWGFPELSFHEQSLPLSKSRGKADSKTACEDLVGSDLPPSEYRLPSFEKVNLIINLIRG